MNRNQYVVVSVFVMFLMFYLPIISEVGQGNMMIHDSVYFGVKNGIISVFMWISFPLFFLFLTLAWFESGKR